MNIQNNISSLNSYQSTLNTSANNIAKGSANGQTDLAKELTDQIIVQDATEVNATAIKTQDEMLGSLLDIKA